MADSSVIMEGENEIPTWVTYGYRVHNLPSTNMETVGRNDYREDVQLLEKEELIPNEEKVCRQGSLDTKYKLLMIYKTVLEKCKRRHTNLD